ncbi:MAG: hypothetical protein LBO75_05145 [Bifidobacteriaceae bacterium]|jgi:hypothetical protein|nr:hypothetical protein [Bifidobacteriaceae bacterium]
MYGWLWRHTPGPWFVKLFLFVAVAAAVVAACFLYLFPWASPLLPFNRVTIEQDGTTIVTVTQTATPPAPDDAASPPVEDPAELPGDDSAAEPVPPSGP